jgi:O-antigen ligase
MLYQMPLAVELAVAAAIACGLALWARRMGAEPLVLSLVPATMLANSGLMPAATYFLPTATLGLSLVISEIGSFARSRSIPPLPRGPLVACAVLYVIAAVLSTAFSIRPETSIPYLAGIIIILIVTLWLGPWILSSSDSAARLFALIGAAGVVLTTLSIVFSLTGPVTWLGRSLGVNLVYELTLNGHPAGIILLRTTGPFLAPGGQALALVPAILALLALRPGLGHRGRLIALLAIIFVTAGLLSTFTRDGWLAVLVGTVVLVARQARSRRIDPAPTAVCLVMGIAVLGILTGVIGADYRVDLTAARNGQSPSVDVAASHEGAIDAVPALQARGGSELSGRLEIWSASVRAIRDSPWVGYGPGTNAIALDPYLAGVSRRFVGLSSHNTWLRTWLEFGILGIAGFVGFVVAVLIVAVRGRPSTPERQAIRIGALAIFVGLFAAQGFETFLLGGVSMPSFVWSMAAGLLALGTGGGTGQESARARL